MYLGGRSRWVPVVIGRTWNDLSQNVTLFKESQKFAIVCDIFLAQTLVLKHKTQIELTQNTSQLSDHIMRRRKPWSQ